MKNNSSKQAHKKSLNPEEDFKGYTMEELKYQRALLALKKEYLKEKALHTVAAVKEEIPVLNGQSAISGLQSKGLLGKIFKTLSFADYLLLGVQGLRIGRKIGTMFKRK